MFKPVLIFIIFVLGSLWGQARSPDWEMERLSGFAEHQSRQVRNEKAREKGEREFLEEKDQWERQRERARHEYKKEKKAAVMSDDGPEARVDAATKRKQQKEYLEAKELFLKERNRGARALQRDGSLPTEDEELGLDQSRPRFDVTKRPDYGGPLKYGRRDSGGSRSGSVPSFPSGNAFPPPPSFPSDSDNPAAIDDFGDIPPPPPPMPFPNGGGDFDDGMGSDFPPPPPPPFPGDGSGEF